jgi:hypothetical protein
LSGNIVLANNTESTRLAIIVQPAQSISVHLTASFGNVTDVTTNSSGKATSTYTSGIMALGSNNTSTGILGAMICSHEFNSLGRVFNYHGFNFHRSQVTDTEFTNSSSMDTNAIQRFFRTRGSFLAKFILVQRIGGFIDTNGNGRLDTSEPTYLVNPSQPIPLHATGVSASSVFFNAATGRGINPKVLIATAEKENSLISRPTLPSRNLLNFAVGCGTPSDFVGQIQCSARTFVNRFHDTRAFGRPISYPFFFHASDGVRHAVTNLGRQPVGFAVNTASTYAQYRYTPFIQSLQNGGGVFLFEKVYNDFGF